MRRSTSDSRARAEISKILDTYVSVLNKDYMASTTAGDMSQSSEEQHVQQALKTYSQMELSGVQIIDHWVDTDGTEYALAALEMDSFKNNLDKMKELNAAVRDTVRANARSEEHTSELQSRFDLVCRLLLEKKKQNGEKPRPGRMVDAIGKMKGPAEL